ncbi:MAG: DUF4333 domain-containing protein [Solirubrobacterales bacterium]|nr:DUF4333 domain-containing protein [Solirubrobacterales bacterium]
MNLPLRSLVALSAAAAALVLTACQAEVSVGDKTVSASELEKQSSASLARKYGEKPASIDCPEDLKAEVGQSEVCSLEDQQGGVYDMKITITSVDKDGNAQFDIKVGGLKSQGVPGGQGANS